MVGWGYLGRSGGGGGSRVRRSCLEKWGWFAHDIFTKLEVRGEVRRKNGGYVGEE